MIDSFTIQTLPLMEPIARRCFKDFKYPGEFNWGHFSALWSVLIEQKTGIILFAKTGDEIVGILGMSVGQDQFNGLPLASGQYWYVVPEARHLGIGSDLQDAAEAIARDAGCYRILMGHPLGHTKFFQSRGFQPIEIGYHKVF